MHTSARVDMELSLNATWQDAFQFGDPTDTTWSFTGQNFKMELKGDIEDTNPILTLSSGTGEIVVDDAVKRVLHFNVDMVSLTNALQPWQSYVYDLIMYDNSVPAVRVSLMHGRTTTTLGVTGS